MVILYNLTRFISKLTYKKVHFSSKSIIDLHELNVETIKYNNNIVSTAYNNGQLIFCNRFVWNHLTTM